MDGALERATGMGNVEVGMGNAEGGKNRR